MAGELPLGAAVALAGVAALVSFRARDRTTRLLSVFLFIEAAHWAAHGSVFWTADAGTGQFLLSTLHWPSYFGFLAMGLFLSAFVGQHERLWWRPATIAGGLAIAAALIIADLLVPRAFYTWSPEGAHVLGGTLGGWSALWGAFNLVLDLYFIWLLTSGLRLTRSPAALAPRALLLVFLVVREAPVLCDFATNPERWAFLGLVGLAAPALPAATFWMHLGAAVVLSFAPLALLGRPLIPMARVQTQRVVFLALLVSSAVAMGAQAAVPMVTVRVFFDVLLIAFLVLRFDTLNGPTVQPRPVDMPLAALFVAVLLFLFVSTLVQALDEWAAVALGLGATGIAAVLTLEICAPRRPAPVDDDVQRAIDRLGADGPVLDDRYLLKRPLGHAPSAVVHARDLQMGRDVVLKLLPHVESEGAHVAREVAALAAVRDARVLRPLGTLTTARGVCLVSPYMPGGDLGSHLRGHGPLDQAGLARIADDLLGALDAVHIAGILHTDIKPANILLDEHGHGRLADFGIARLPDLESTLTLSEPPHHVAGTPRYMSPEQAAGGRLEAASDLYSAALVIYEAAVGTPYHPAAPGDDAATLQRAVARGHPWPLRSKTGGPLATVLARALAVRPADRYPDAGYMRAALGSALGEPAALDDLRAALRTRVPRASAGRERLAVGTIRSGVTVSSPIP